MFCRQSFLKTQVILVLVQENTFHTSIPFWQIDDLEDSTVKIRYVRINSAHNLTQWKWSGATYRKSQEL